MSHADKMIQKIVSALTETDDGVIIDIDVTPGSRKKLVPSGYNEWRNRIEVKLTKPPVDGKANKELIESISDILSIPKKNITIISGSTNSKKSVKVLHMTKDEAARILAESIAELTATTGSSTQDTLARYQ